MSGNSDYYWALIKNKLGVGSDAEVEKAYENRREEKDNEYYAENGIRDPRKALLDQLESPVSSGIEGLAKAAEELPVAGTALKVDSIPGELVGSAAKSAAKDLGASDSTAAMFDAAGNLVTPTPLMLATSPMKATSLIKGAEGLTKLEKEQAAAKSAKAFEEARAAKAAADAQALATDPVGSAARRVAAPPSKPKVPNNGFVAGTDVPRTPETQVEIKAARRADSTPAAKPEPELLPSAKAKSEPIPQSQWTEKDKARIKARGEKQVQSELASVDTSKGDIGKLDEELKANNAKAKSEMQNYVEEKKAQADFKANKGKTTARGNANPEDMWAEPPLVDNTASTKPAPKAEAATPSAEAKSAPKGSNNSGELSPEALASDPDAASKPGWMKTWVKEHPKTVKALAFGGPVAGVMGAGMAAKSGANDATDKAQSRAAAAGNPAPTQNAANPPGAPAATPPSGKPAPTPETQARQAPTGQPEPEPTIDENDPRFDTPAEEDPYEIMKKRYLETGDARRSAAQQVLGGQLAGAKALADRPRFAETPDSLKKTQEDVRAAEAERAKLDEEKYKGSGISSDKSFRENAAAIATALSMLGEGGTQRVAQLENMRNTTFDKTRAEADKNLKRKQDLHAYQQASEQFNRETAGQDYKAASDYYKNLGEIGGLGLNFMEDPMKEFQVSNAVQAGKREDARTEAYTKAQEDKAARYKTVDELSARRLALQEQLANIRKDASMDPAKKAKLEADTALALQKAEKMRQDALDRAKLLDAATTTGL